jgi:pimeloyl-ACP methyl ester carboxylesterase
MPRRVSAVHHEVDGVQLRSYAVGPLDAPRTFVLLHGIGMSHRTFSRLVAPLRRHGRVVAVDLAGFGANRPPRRRVGIADHARFVARVLEDRGVTRAIAVGHSMGTQVAVELAALAPDVVEGVVLIGPVVDPERPGAVRQGLALARDCLGEPLGVDALLFADYVRGGLAWYLRQLPEMLHHPIVARASVLAQPVLLVRGHDDPIGTRDWCARLAAACSDARVIELGRSRHVVPRTEPAELARELGRFAASIEAPAETSAEAPAETTADAPVVEAAR